MNSCETAMIVVSYGGGTNSTALLVGARERGLRPDHIVFADTGSEMPHTYEHLDAVDAWLERQGWPRISRVKWIRRDGTFVALHDACLDRAELPSKAYGFSGCTTKWKQQPIDRYIDTHLAASRLDALVEGEALHLERWIGYDADEPQRAERMLDKHRDDSSTMWRAPLMEWGWGRDECVAAIARAGLPQPGKSSCFMCPSMRVPEIVELKRRHPKHAELALTIERRALSARASQVAAGEATAGTIYGLGRRFAWSEVLEGKEVEESPPEIECGCYDGDE